MFNTIAYSHNRSINVDREVLYIVSSWIPGRILFDSVAQNVRLNQDSGWSLDVSQLELREPGRLQVAPRRPGEHASVPEVVPQGLENMLEEVQPGGGLCNHMVQEVEGSPLELPNHTG